MVALAIDREQLREDVKVWFQVVGGLVAFVLMAGLIAEIWQVIDFLPRWVDALIVVAYLVMFVYMAYNRYTVEENASNSDSN